MRADLDMLIPEMASSRLRHAVIKCARGDLPPNMGLMHALIAANDASEAERSFSIALAAAERGGAQLEAARLRAAIELWRRTPDAYRVVRSVLAIEGGEASEIGRTSQWGPVFDQAAEISPEAAVALYSLGSATLLEAATQLAIDTGEAGPLDAVILATPAPSFLKAARVEVSADG